MRDLYAMPITKHYPQCLSLCCQVGHKHQRSNVYHTWQQSYSLYAYLSAGDWLCIKNYPPELMPPSSSTYAKTVSAENQNGATIVKAIFFFCHYYMGINYTGEARRQSWSENLKSRCIPGGLCGLYEWYKLKIFSCVFCAAAMMMMVAAATIVLLRWC